MIFYKKPVVLHLIYSYCNSYKALFKNTKRKKSELNLLSSFSLKMFEITLKFLAAVEKNNTTEWLHTNYDLYQQERKRFQRFLEPLLQSAKDLFPFRSELKVSQTMFRFNKDLRYSREKTPYKNHF
jgi:hypothetical protein